MKDNNCVHCDKPDCESTVTIEVGNLGEFDTTVCVDCGLLMIYYYTDYETYIEYNSYLGENISSDDVRESVHQSIADKIDESVEEIRNKTGDDTSGSL